MNKSPPRLALPAAGPLMLAAGFSGEKRLNPSPALINAEEAKQKQK